ncbi:MAG TPA: MFS transporter [Candidatus Binatia bacterium]|jgi:MFS family permease
MRSLSRPWAIAALVFVTLGFGRGLHSSFGVFYVALLDAFGWSRAVTAGAFSVVLIVDAVISPIVGHLLDRFGPKKIVGAGCLLLASGLLLSSRIHSLWEFYLYFGLVSALGLSFMGMVPHVVLISEWFTTKRASALGVVYAGAGVGILLLAPLTEWLISSWGWERALQTLVLVIVIGLLPMVLIFYQPGPYAEKQGEENKAGNRWTAKLALKSGQFWLIFFARVFAAGGTTVIVTHQVAHVVDIGYSRLYAATVFGLVGMASTAGRVVFGYVADLVSKQGAYTLNILTTLVGVAALMIAADTSRPWLLYVYVIFFGIGFGSRAVIFSALSADIFSGKGFGAIFGYSVVSVGVGGALGSWLGGYFYDLSGSYLVSFALSTFVLLLSDLCIWLVTARWVVSYDQRLWEGQNAVDLKQ